MFSERQIDMIFRETKLPGACIMELEKFEDDRGFFAHGWSPKELARQRLEAPVAESAISFNKRKKARSEECITRHAAWPDQNCALHHRIYL